MPTKKELDELFEDEMKLDILATQRAFRLSRKIAAELKAELNAERRSRNEVRSTKPKEGRVQRGDRPTKIKPIKSK